jgi:acetyl esterase
VTELHPEAQELAAKVAEAGLRPFCELTAAEARAQVAGLRGALGAGDAPDPPAEHAAPGREGPIPVYVYEPAGPPRGVIVFAHGGGWVVCTPDDADALCRRLAASTACIVANVDYRLAPEHPFPAPVDDLDDACTWAAARWPALPLVVAGESAGGNLAAAVALRAAAEGAGRIAGQALIYPVTDCDLDTPSYRAHASSPFLTRDDMAWFWDRYAPETAQREHPHASPLRATALQGSAPAVLVLAGQDPLHDEGAAYGEALRAAGVAVTILDHDDLPHGFLSMLGALEAAEQPYEAFAAALARLVDG